MANPGLYFPHASDTMWPFLAFIGAVISVPLLAFAILMVIVGQISRIRAVAAAVLMLAIATASLAGYVRADLDYREAEVAHRAAYVGRVGGWLEQAYGAKLAEAELSTIWGLRPGGISRPFEVATTFIVIRADRDTGRLVVTDRNGAAIFPIQP
jgi:hypothetical protein